MIKANKPLALPRGEPDLKEYNRLPVGPVALFGTGKQGVFRSRVAPASALAALLALGGCEKPDQGEVVIRINCINRGGVNIVGPNGNAATCWTVSGSLSPIPSTRPHMGCGQKAESNG